MTEGVRIRLATAGDADAIRSIYAPYVTSTPVSFEAEPPTAAEVAERIDETMETHPWLVCERDGEILGYAKAGPLRSYAAYRWTAELTVYVDEEARRRGVATALYGSLLACLALQGFKGAYAAVTVPNPESLAFHERLGFEEVGRFPRAGYVQGDWYDVRWLYRSIDHGDRGRDLGLDPPTPLPTAVDDPRWETALRAGERHLAF